MRMKLLTLFENGYTIRRPLKDYISKRIYEIRKNHSKSQPQTNLERAEKSIKIEKYFLNIRGLILYILGKTTPNKNENKNKNSLNQKEVLKK